MQPKISILLPTYNGARFLTKQIDSILAQTDPDFELIIIDDGSTDQTATILQNYKDRDARISVIDSSGNRGQTSRLTELLSSARGDYVAISDQDDIWAPDRNARLLAAIGDFSASFGRSDLIDAEGTQLGFGLLDRRGIKPSSTFKLQALMQPIFSAHAMLVRRDAINPAALHQSLPFDWLIALDALFSGGVVYEDSAVVYHRMHDSNQVNKIDIRRKRHLTKADVREAVLYQTPDRLRFWQVLSYLGRSQQLDVQVRRLFQNLAERCYSAWFAEWRKIGGRDRRLRPQIAHDLESLAASDQDYEAFLFNLGGLCALPISLPAARQIGKRLQRQIALIR